MPNERHYDVIDYLKFFCAFLVIAIHTRPFLTFSEIADTIYNRDISNYAVPFFYACTGFLLTVRNQNIPFERKLKSSIRKITKSYFVWTAIYLPLTIYGWISSGKSLLINLILFIRNFLFVGENYYSWTLWYLNGLIFCLVLLLFLHRKLSLMQIFKLSSLLYLAGLILEIGRECSGVLPVYLQYAIKIYYSLFCTVRNGLFRSLVFVVLGIMIGIKTSTIEAAILNAIKAMTKEIIENEDEFAEQLQAAWENQNTQVSSESKKELHSVQKRIDELDALIRSLYENSILGKIPERQYQRLMAQYDEEQTVCEARIAELKKELDVVETTKVDLKRFIKLIRKYKDCETLTDEMLYELVEKVVIHSASGGRTIYRQQQIDIYFNFIGDTFPSQIEISRGDKKNLTEQQLAKRKKYQKTAGENRKKKRAALREAAKTDPQAAAEYEALLQKGRERCRKYAQNKKLAQQEPADTVPIQFEPSFETPEEMKGESA